MILKENQAAHLLEGKILPGGWKVMEKLDGSSSSNAIYSCYYRVENEDRKGFLKAFDYSAADKINEDSAEELKNMLNAFTLEREILEKCTENGCKNVIELLDSGSLNVEEAPQYPRVDYLILEWADLKDVRDALHEQLVTLEWKIRSLHQLALGLNELHKLSIAHQDVKPSNLVRVSHSRTKISDFGSAVSINSFTVQLPQHLSKNYCGSWEYAPPELLYGDVNDDPVIRRIGCDLYLLGSMIAFYFTNMSMTSLIRYNLSDSLCWTNSTNYGNYKNLKSYVVQAFERALLDVGRMIESPYLREKLTTALRYLCNPDPYERGHKKNIDGIGGNFSLERFISLFDLLARKIKLHQI